MKNTIAIEFLKKNRYNVNFVDGNADAQNSGMEIFEKLEDADSRGLLTGPEYSHKGDLLEGSRHFLFQMKKAIAIYEQENPKK